MSLKKIISTTTLLFALLLVKPATAQEKLEISFDHMALLVSNIEKSADFYENVLLLKEIPSPIESVDRKWFSLGGNYQLHLIKEDRPIVQNDVAMHFSVVVNDLDEYIKFLDDHEVPYTNWPTTAKAISVRPDNVRQVYLKDPDGYWIEINDATYAK